MKIKYKWATEHLKPKQIYPDKLDFSLNEKRVSFNKTQNIRFLKKTTILLKEEVNMTT